MPKPIKVTVAAIERGERRAFPQIPCPLVHPDPRRVPNPTNSPATINNGTLLLIVTAGKGAPNWYNNGETMSPKTNSTCQTSTFFGLSKLALIPLTHAMRPMPSNKMTVATPIIAPPTKDIGVNACQSTCMFIIGTYAYFYL